MGGKKSKRVNKKKSSNNDDADAAVEDERFAMAKPHFQNFPKSGSSGLLTTSSNKIVLDDRFSSVLTDSRFQLQEKDKYGRKKKQKEKQSTARDELKAFYVVKNKDDDDIDDEQNGRKGQTFSHQSDDNEPDTDSMESKEDDGAEKEEPNQTLKERHE